MKKLLFLFGLIASIQSFGQAGDNFTFTPYTVSRVRSSDSVQINFQLSTNNAVAASIKSVVQTAGPAVKWNPASTWISGTTVNYSFWLQGLAPGTYSFTATGLSGSGTTGTQTNTIVVIADQVCPPVPAPRIASSITLTIFGTAITIPLPATGAGVKYTDGSTQ